MPALKSQNDLEHIKIQWLLKDLGTEEDGLSSGEAYSRQKMYGLNELPAVIDRFNIKVARHLWRPFPVLFGAALIISLFMGDYRFIGLLLAILAAKFLIDAWQNHQIGKSVAFLNEKLSPTIRVLRDRNWIRLQAKYLVPGDVILLQEGDMVPADVKLIAGESLRIAGTVSDDREDYEYKNLLDEVTTGTVVAAGMMRAVVIRTGKSPVNPADTSIHRNQTLNNGFIVSVKRISNYLVVSSLLWALLIFMVALFEHQNIPVAGRFFILLVIASMPFSLAGIAALMLSIETYRLARRQVFLRDIRSLQDLAEMDTLCLGVNGFITSDKLSLGEPVPLGHFQKVDVLRFAALSSAQESANRIDTAVLQRAEEDHVLSHSLKNYVVKSRSAFDPEKKRSEVKVLDINGKLIDIVKGSPEVIFAYVNNDPDVLEENRKKIQEYGTMGYRLLALAVRVEMGEWEIAGLLPFRADILEKTVHNIERLKLLGIDTKVLTAGCSSFARYLLNRLGMAGSVYGFSDLENLDAHEKEEKIVFSNSISGLYPKRKSFIINLLQQRGGRIGLTGRHRSDCGALIRSDNGIVSNNAGEAVRSSAATVLGDPGISGLVTAVEHARQFFQRFNSYLIYRVAESFRLLLFITLAVLVFNFYPVTAAMLGLLIAFTEFPVFAIVADKTDFSIKTERWHLSHQVGIGIVLGIVNLLATFLIFYIGRDMFAIQSPELQTFMFLFIAVSAQFTLFLTRTGWRFWATGPSAKVWGAAVLGKALATLFAVAGWFMAPISWRLITGAWGYALAVFLASGLIKFYIYRLFEQ